jgi:uncharacterized protein (TIGR02996 family)
VSDRDAFLAAIHDAPDDDAPRLVFADWLEENGEPERAEFIRVQVEMRRERERHDRITPRLDELFLRQKEIFARPWGDVARGCGADAISHYSRGFPNYLRVTATQFVELGPNIGIWIGPQTRIGLYECAGMTNRLSNERSLRHVRFLVIGRGHEQSPHRDEDLEAFFASPHLANLRELEIRPPSRSFRDPPPQPLSARTAIAIASATSLTALERLDVSGIPIRGDGVAALARASHLVTLRTLTVGSAAMTRRAVESLRRSPYLTQLKCLEIVGGELAPETLTRLTEQFGPEVVQNRVNLRITRR